MGVELGTEPEEYGLELLAGGLEGGSRVSSGGWEVHREDAQPRLGECLV